MILPTGAHSFKEAMKMGTEVYHTLKEIIQETYGSKSGTCTLVGDEGGFAPETGQPKEVLDLIKKAIQKAGYTGRIDIGMDAAASEFYRSGKNYSYYGF